MNTTHYKVDLHTHSIISRDGSLTMAQYEQILAKGILDAVAITDHNEVSFALSLHKKLGEKIIVGEEIATKDGEMIGLFLKEKVFSGLSAAETAKAIHSQGGLVLIPHPFETFRKGIQGGILEAMHDTIDIIETFNARACFRGKAETAKSFVRKYALASASDSDAHGYYGVGSAFSLLKEMPTKHNLTKLLRDAQFKKSYAPMWTYLYPAMNRIRSQFD